MTFMYIAMSIMVLCSVAEYEIDPKRLSVSATRARVLYSIINAKRPKHKAREASHKAHIERPLNASD